MEETGETEDQERGLSQEVLKGIPQKRENLGNLHTEMLVRKTLISPDEGSLKTPPESKPRKVKSQGIIPDFLNQEKEKKKLDQRSA